jgi:membrane dipeptidase
MAPKNVCRAMVAMLCLVSCTEAFRASDSTSAPVQRAPAGETKQQELLARARSLHERILTIDSHTGLIRNPDHPCGASDAQVDFPKMMQGGLDAAFFIVWARQRKRTAETYAEAKQRALDKFREFHDVVRQCADEVALARTPEEVEGIAADGKLAFIVGIENGFVLGRDLSLLHRYRELGASYLGLVHEGHNDLADSSDPSEKLGDVPSEHGGVSKLGEQVIAEMNRLGLMVDLSHMSKAARLDAIRLSRAPVIDSHSSMHALVPDRRNMDDETLRALAKKGGVVQITAVSLFVKGEPPEATAAYTQLFHEFGIEYTRQANRLPPERRAEFQRRYQEMEKRWPLATVADFVDHIDHAVKLVGIDHVGISSDFEGGGELTGWADASETVNVTAELLRRGYTEEQIRKIWGGNLLRVWREVRRVSAAGK